MLGPFSWHIFLLRARASGGCFLPARTRLLSKVEIWVNRPTRCLSLYTAIASLRTAVMLERAAITTAFFSESAPYSTRDEQTKLLGQAS